MEWYLVKHREPQNVMCKILHNNPKITASIQVTLLCGSFLTTVMHHIR